MNAENPEPTRREDLAGLLADLEHLESIFASWDEGQRNAVQAYRHAVDAVNAEALRRLIRALKMDPAALGAMKLAASDEVVYAVLRHHGLIKPSLNERVEAALDGIRPMLASHGGNVTVTRIEPPRVEVRFDGACTGCAASALTFQAGVKKAIEEACPEITEVVQAGPNSVSTDGARFVSPFALHTEGTWLSACSLAAIPDGGLRAMEIGGHDVVMFRRGEAVTCFQNACAHMGLAIDAGAVADGIVTCPHHGFRYDLASGECLTAPEVQLQAHAVRILGDRVEVRIAA